MTNMASSPPQLPPFKTLGIPLENYRAAEQWYKDRGHILEGNDRAVFLQNISRLKFMATTGVICHHRLGKNAKKMPSLGYLPLLYILFPDRGDVVGSSAFKAIQAANPGTDFSTFIPDLDEVRLARTREAAEQARQAVLAQEREAAARALEAALVREPEEAYRASEGVMARGREAYRAKDTVIAQGREEAGQSTAAAEANRLLNSPADTPEEDRGNSFRASEAVSPNPQINQFTPINPTDPGLSPAFSHAAQARRRLPDAPPSPFTPAQWAREPAATQHTAAANNPFRHYMDLWHPESAPAPIDLRRGLKAIQKRMATVHEKVQDRHLDDHKRLLEARNHWGDLKWRLFGDMKKVDDSFDQACTQAIDNALSSRESMQGLQARLEELVRQMENK